MSYSNKTTQELINTCAWIDNEATATHAEKEAAKDLIKKELRRRFNAVFEFIDDGQNAQNPASTIEYLQKG